VSSPSRSRWRVSRPRPPQLAACIGLLCDPHELSGLSPESVQLLARDAFAGDVGRLWVVTPADQPGDVLAALASSPHPGRIAFTWPPRIAPEGEPWAAELAELLLTTAADYHAREGAEVCQCLVWNQPASLPDPELPGWLDEALQRSGFVHRTALDGREAELTDLRVPERPAKMEPYEPKLDSEWTALVAETLKASRDCPYLEGRRTGRDLLDSLAPSDSACASWWWRAIDPDTDQPSAVLLLDPCPGTDRLEIAYLGVVPGYRGKGLGRRLVAEAAAVARAAGKRRIRVTADASNIYAASVYNDCNLRIVTRALASVRLADRPGAASG